MTRKKKQSKTLVSVLADFVNSTADFVTQEQQADLEDYRRISHMLSEASMSLRQCFREIDTLLSEVDLDQGIKERLEHQYNTSIRILQFEDIVQQMLQHSQGQKNALVEAMRVLHKATDQLKSSPSAGKEFLKVVSECKSELQALIGAHKSINPVKQESLDSGDVELF